MKVLEIKNIKKSFNDQTLHPNDIGFVAYATKLVADLRKYL